MPNSEPLRKHLSDLLRMKGAHLGFDEAVAAFPVELRGIKPLGAPHTPWQLLEHLRIAQWDILDFSRNPAYQEMKWPDDYWPKSPKPPTPGAWQQSVVAFRADRRSLERLLADPALDLYAKIPHGEGQTYLREFLLVADHGAFHTGQLVAVRRLLGAWNT